MSCYRVLFLLEPYASGSEVKGWTYTEFWWVNLLGFGSFED